MHIRHDEERLSAFLDDELDERGTSAVLRHVGDCADCEGRLDELRRTRAALRALPPVEAPLSFMVESVVLGPPDGDDGPSTVFAIGAVVAASVLLITAFVLGGERGGAVTPDVDLLVDDHIESVGGGPVVVPVMLEPADG